MSDPSWRRDAACRGHRLDVWFVESPHEIHPVAARRCGICPVAEPCLDYALRHDVDGVWAGTVPAERRNLRRLRGIRPREVALDLRPLMNQPPVNPKPTEEHEGEVA